ncbi:TPA: hypothetical protein ACN9VU_004869 [Yersinia enterocolitica]|nr:hypothetical protein [Yersinia enterocolitica]
MSEIKELKRFIYSATVTSGSGSQSFYIDAKNREEADARAANNESNGMYADDSEITDLDALEYEDETTVDDFGDFPLISREQSLIAQLEAAQKERDEFRLAFQQNEQAKQELFAQKDLLITANLNISRRAETAEAALSAANEKPIQITLGAGDVMISHIKWPDAQGISFAPMPTGYTGIGLNVDEQVSGKNSGEIGANVIIKSSSIESLKVLRDIVLIAIAGFTVEGE